MTTEISNLTAYNDYRDWLKDEFALVKERNKKISFQYIATKTKTTKSYFKLVIEKKRHISADKLWVFCDFFQFTDFQKQKFVFLYLKNTVKNKKLNDFFSGVLSGYGLEYDDPSTLRKLTTPDSFKHEEHLFETTEWVALAIMELMRHPDYRHEAVWFHEKLGGSAVLSLERVEKSLASIEKYGLIKKVNDQWQVHRTEQFQTTPPYSANPFLKFISGLERAQIAMQSHGKSNIHNPSRYHFSCHNIGRDDIDKILELYDEFEKKLWQISSSSTTPEMLLFITNNVFRGSTYEPKTK